MDNKHYIETKFQHLDGFFALVKGIGKTDLATQKISLDDMKAAYAFPASTATLTEGPTVATDPHGLIFLPDRNIVSTSGDDVQFFTQGLKVILVRLVSTAGLPDKIELYPPDPHATGATLQSVPATASNTVDLHNFFSLLASNFKNWSTLLFNYQNTQEFDFAYLDWATFKYLSEYNGFYAAGQSVVDRGLHYTRSAVALPLIVDGHLEYLNFRTLKFAPYPLPDPLNDSMGREDIAYHIAQECPPTWWDTSVAMAADTDASGDAAPPIIIAREAAPAPVQYQYLDPTANDPFSGQRVRVFDLYSALNHAGYIGNRIRKINVWPPVIIWLLSRLILLILAVWLAVRLVKSFNG